MKAPGLSLPAVIPPEGPRRARVALFAGCVMDALFTSVNRDTAEVLRRNGCEVIVPRGQGCCGALHVHEGRRSEAARLARRNLHAFAPDDVDAIVVNAAGCGSVLKEQAARFREDPGACARAERFAKKTRDVSEFLADLGVRPPSAPRRSRLVYDAPCHLLHAQRVARAPLEILRAIPGAEVIEGPDSAFCCGSAGIYNLTHPGVAMAMIDRKMKAIAPLDPDIVVSGNPGCLLQLRLGVSRAGRRARVRHPVEVLAEAYRAGDGGT
jgi:glycolate oxidase iron-sulfur subunit